MELIELTANVRTTVGNSPARALRRQGQIPAILYGPQSDTAKLAVNNHEFEQALKNSKGSQVFINLKIDGESAPHPVMVKELQTHPVSREFLHVDFYKISMDRKIKVRVPVSITGKSKGVELDGILQVVRRDLEIQCLPDRIPDTIVIDVTDLDIGESIHVNSIPLADDIEIMADVNFTVVTVLSPTVQEEEEAEAVEEEEEAEAADGEEATEADS